MLPVWAFVCSLPLAFSCCYDTPNSKHVVVVVVVVVFVVIVVVVVVVAAAAAKVKLGYIIVCSKA